MSSESGTGVEKSKGYRPSMQILGWMRVLSVTRSMELFATATFWFVLKLSVQGLRPDPTSGYAILPDEVINISSAVSIDVAAIRAIALPIL
jgi:hypothetical protein